jgi:hypothetical protein
MILIECLKTRYTDAELTEMIRRMPCEKQGKRILYYLFVTRVIIDDGKKTSVKKIITETGSKKTDWLKLMKQLTSEGYAKIRKSSGISSYYRIALKKGYCDYWFAPWEYNMPYSFYLQHGSIFSKNHTSLDRKTFAEYQFIFGRMLSLQEEKCA